MQRRRFLFVLLACSLMPATRERGWAQGLRPAEQLAATDALGGVISSIDGTDRQIPALHDKEELGADQVRVVDVGRRLDDGDGESLDAAIERNARALADLRAALDNRPVIKQRLAEHDMRLDDVVGVRADIPGNVIVYVKR